MFDAWAGYDPKATGSIPGRRRGDWYGSMAGTSLPNLRDYSRAIHFRGTIS